ICARGVRSARMTNRLTQAGLTQIIDIPEGMLGSFAGPGWVKRDLPIRVWSENG
ncbi:MAG: rhodanese-like domain-containing protein, partial [Pseudomonadota bacterium]